MEKSQRYPCLLLLYLSFFLLILADTHGDAPGDIALSFGSPGTGPTGLTFGDGYLWCADEDTDIIYKLDPAAGSVASSFPSPSSCPRGLAWDDDGYLWCADSCSDTIYKIDPSSGSIVEYFSSPGSTPRGLVFFDGYLRVSDSNSKLIYKVDPATGSSVSTISVANSYPRGLAWDGSHLWNIDGEAESIYRMDQATGDVDIIIPALCDFGYGLTWDGAHLWYADNTGAMIYKAKRDGAELYAQTKPRYFSISFTHTSTYSAGYCTTNLAVPVDSLHQSLTRGITYNPGGLPSATDQWGQDAARYSRWVYGDSTVSWDVGAVTRNLRYFLEPALCGTVADIPGDVISEYTIDGEQFDITNPVITGAAAAAVGVETNLYWMYRNIHDYVIDHLYYADGGPGWQTAPEVLSRGYGTCSEYSYVFVAICRAAGLPARYQGGSRLRVDDVPYTDTVFHRWHEMYIPHYGGWLPVDCTRDDRAYPGARLQHFGGIPNTFFVTTTGGGGSTYLDWNYNSHDDWSIGYGGKSRSFYWYANTPASASSAASTGGSCDITAAYVLTDAEGDWTNIRVEYSEDSGATWTAATEGAGGDGTQELTASAAGISHTFVWDSVPDIGYTNQSDIRLRFTPYIEDDGAPAETEDFSINNLFDTDGDGLYDHEEPGYGTAVDDADSDDDGFSDLVEVAAGSDPVSAGSTPSIVRISFGPEFCERPSGYATDSGEGYDSDRKYGWW